MTNGRFARAGVVGLGRPARAGALGVVVRPAVGGLVGAAVGFAVSAGVGADRADDFVAVDSELGAKLQSMISAQEWP